MNNGPDLTKLGKDRDVLAPSDRSERADGLYPQPDSEPDPQFEQLLWQALRPEDPYAGFADRVMTRALAEEAPVQLPASFSGTRKLLHWPQSRLWISGAVAAALLLGLFEGEVSLRRAREQQRRIREATQQFQTTERVTVRALAQAREQLQRAGVPFSLD